MVPMLCGFALCGLTALQKVGITMTADLIIREHTNGIRDDAWMAMADVYSDLDLHVTYIPSQSYTP